MFEFLGGIVNTLMGKRQADKNIQLQKEFAQSGIRWKVADAKKAGIHPLYALGAQTAQFSPVSVGGDMASAGQGLDRAIASTASHGERQGGLAQTLLEKQIAKTDAEIAFINARTASINQAGGNPAIPMPTDNFRIDGQGATRLPSVDTSSPLFTHDRAVALVKPPSGDVQGVKHMGYSLVRNPRDYSSGDAFQKEFGDEGVHNWIHGGLSYINALARAIYEWRLSQAGPRDRIRLWHDAMETARKAGRR